MATVEIHSGDVYTVTTGDTIKYYTDGEDPAKVIISNQTFMLFRSDYDELIFTTNYDQVEDLQVYSVIRVSNGETYEYFDERPFHDHLGVKLTIEVTAETNSYFIFTVDIAEAEQGPIQEFPQDWQDTMYAKLNDQSANPNKTFSEFNDDHARWRFYDKLRRAGMLDTSDFPPEPKIEDYS